MGLIIEIGIQHSKRRPSEERTSRSKTRVDQRVTTTTTRRRN